MSRRRGEDSDRILLVTPYAPWRDGIAAYALQQAKALVAQGHHVEVLSPVPSAAHHHFELKGPAGARRMGRLAKDFDQVIIHFHPDFFYQLPPTAGARMSTGLAYGTLFRKLRGRVELRLHEIDRSWALPSDPAVKATRFLLKGAGLITVHSQTQVNILVDEFGVSAKSVSLVDHGADFVSRTSASKMRARASLGIEDDAHVFLCIGFLQHHKGFDRAARAFGGLAERGGRLDIVGSARLQDGNTLAHVAELESLAATIDGVHLHLGFPSDEMFDRWIVASDTVVLPYRHIWSSSVLERARLFGRPVIVTNAGGLADQVAGWDDATIVADNSELARAMAARLGIDVAKALNDPWPSHADQAYFQTEIEARARAARGGAPAARTWGRGRERPALSAPVRKLGVIETPPAVSERLGVSLIKRLIRRVIAWEVRPIADQVDRLQRATAEALDDAEKRRDL